MSTTEKKDEPSRAHVNAHRIPLTNQHWERSPSLVRPRLRSDFLIAVCLLEVKRHAAGLVFYF